MSHSEIGGLFVASIWWIWHWRVNTILDHKPWDINFVIRQILLFRTDIKQCGEAGRALLASDYLAHIWCPPTLGFFKLNIDGCWSKNPSCMGIGGVLRDHEGCWVEGFLVCFVGGITFLICETDSLEVVENLNNYVESPLHPHKDILSHIKELLRKDWQVSIVHVFREANMVADKLSRLGDSSSPQTLLWRSPPPSVKVLIDQDILASNLPLS
ncbi:Ribonuclease H-like superfamily [Sesbania bispinosa]|nr:Ribonuclease H-like superfamily [Sesbania bispinosa]